MKTFPTLLLALIFLAGCQTSTYMSSAASDGDGVTCSEIYQAFSAYEQDRQSAQSLRQLAQLVSPELAVYAEKGMASAESYYPQAKASANLALAVRGCGAIR